MSKNLTEVDEYTANVTVPEGGDSRTAASVETPFQALANRTFNHKGRLDTIDSTLGSRDKLVENGRASGNGDLTDHLDLDAGGRDVWQDVTSVTLTQVANGDRVHVWAHLTARATGSSAGQREIVDARITQHPSGGSESQEAITGMRLHIDSALGASGNLALVASFTLASGSNNTITLQARVTSGGNGSGAAVLEGFGLVAQATRNVPPE